VLLAVSVGIIVLLLAAGVFYLGTIAYNQIRQQSLGSRIEGYISNVRDSLDSEDQTAEETEQQDSTETEREEIGKQDSDSQQTSAPQEEIGNESTGQEENETEEAVANNNEQPTASENQKTQTENLEQQEENNVEPGSQAEENSTVTDNEAEEGTISTVDEEDKVMIQIETIAESWYSVEIDGESVFQGLVAAGTTESFSGREIKVRIGNAAGVIIEKDGETYGPFGEEGEIVTEVFSSSEAEESNSASEE
jgi:cytoskeletal protein RodZ